MISELVVDVQPKEVSIAVLEDKSLVELQKEARNVSFAVGDIYLGKVKKLMPGLNAATVLLSAWGWVHCLWVCSALLSDFRPICSERIYGQGLALCLP